MSETSESETSEPAVTAPPERPWVLTVVFEVRAGLEDEFLRLMQIPLNAMRHEPAFISASLARHPDDPGKFFLHEVWTSREQFVGTEIFRDYRTEYEERTVPMLRCARVYSEWYEMRADYAIHVRR